MKRLVSAILILMLLCGCAMASEASEDINKMLTTLYWMYSMDNDLDIKYIDLAAAYLILEADTHLMTSSNILEFKGMEETYEAGVRGWMEIIRNISDMRISYSDGQITKEMYAKKLFTIIKAVLDTAE